MHVLVQLLLHVLSHDQRGSCLVVLLCIIACAMELCMHMLSVPLLQGPCMRWSICCCCHCCLSIIASTNECAAGLGAANPLTISGLRSVAVEASCSHNRPGVRTAGNTMGVAPCCGVPAVACIAILLCWSFKPCSPQALQPCLKLSAFCSCQLSRFDVVHVVRQLVCVSWQPARS